MEQTLLILKPDAVARGLIGRIVTRIEDKGLSIVGLKLMQVSREQAERHYAVHKGKAFFDDLLNYITSGPVVVLCIEGLRAITICRKLMGKTFGYEAEPGTIRGDYGNSRTYNLIHGSDSPETAAFEIGLYFTPQELIKGPHPLGLWLSAPVEK